MFHFVDDENHVSSATSSPNRTSRLGRLDQGSGSLLKSLLTRNATASPQQTGFAFPPGKNFHCPKSLNFVQK